MAHWWDDMSAAVEATGLGRHSAEWYAAMRDEYDRRFPDADQRSRDNMRLMAEWAADRPCAGNVAGVQLALDFGHPA